jgi:predicted dithiol-disulfide oxidoreductase (DUF899 family)
MPINIKSIFFIYISLETTLLFQKKLSYFKVSLKTMKISNGNKYLDELFKNKHDMLHLYMYMYTLTFSTLLCNFCRTSSHRCNVSIFSLLY